MEKSPVIGIYCITERATGKRYVGQSRNVHARRWQHRGRFPLETHDYEVLAECPLEELDDLERRFILELNTQHPHGFNMTKGGQTWDMVWTPEMIENVSRKRKENWADPQKRAKYVEARIKAWSDPTLREAASVRNSEVGNRPEVKEIRSKNTSSSWQDPEVRQRHIEGRLRRWSSEEARQEQSRKLIEANADPALRAAKSQASKEYWSDPQKREEHSQKLRGRPKQRVECPHCRTSVAVTMAKRWHFDNCKKK